MAKNTTSMMPKFNGPLAASADGQKFEQQKPISDMNVEELNALDKKLFTEDEHKQFDRRMRKLTAPPVPKPAKSFIEESREALKFPCPPGMKFFESPEGIIMLGEASVSSLWCQRAHGGKGADILPMRPGNPDGEAKLRASGRL